MTNVKNLIIGTGCYSNVKTGNTVSVTGDGGNAWNYFGPAYKKLAPSLKLYTYWRDNPDKLSKEELINYYIQEYFRHRLENLDLNDLFQIFEERFGDKIILLCHELPGEFCHRRVIAGYIELKTGLYIPEIGNDTNGNLVCYSPIDYKQKLKLLLK